VLADREARWFSYLRTSRLNVYTNERGVPCAKKTGEWLMEATESRVVAIGGKLIGG